MYLLIFYPQGGKTKKIRIFFPESVKILTIRTLYNISFSGNIDLTFPAASIPMAGPFYLPNAIGFMLKLLIRLNINVIKSL